MDYRVLILRIEAERLPDAPGTVARLDLDESFAPHIEGWQVISHTVSQQLSGEMLLTLFCGRS